jgi:hypothetical protein
MLTIIKNPLVALIVGVLIGAASMPIILEKVKKPVEFKCPEPAACICPEQKPCNGIDFDKIKSKALTIHNTQHLTVSGDSLIEQKIKEVIAAEFGKLRLAKCKY